jgi:hypothetical protein
MDGKEEFIASGGIEGNLALPQSGEIYQEINTDFNTAFVNGCRDVTCNVSTRVSRLLFS